MDFRARYKFDVEKDFLGKGEFSRVYRATDILLERVVALKFFTTSTSESHQILNEIKKVIHFEHPNLCKYYDVEVLSSRNIIGEEERIEVGIMEYLDGGSFKSFVRAQPQFTDKLLIDVLNGLSYLHNEGIVHRDLKPQNILIKMVNDKPVAKITDFKNSRLINSIEDDLEALPGTIEYIAPEQFSPKKYGIGGKIATNLDLWSFGLIVYEALNGAPLFGSRSAGISAEQIMTNILNDDNRAKLEAVPLKYRKILELCLVKDASKRVQNAADLIQLLSDGTVQSGSQVFVTAKTVHPKIVDTGDAKPFAAPKMKQEKKPEAGNNVQQRVPESGLSEQHPIPDEQQQTPDKFVIEKGTTQAAAATDEDITRPLTVAGNRLTDETSNLHTEQNRYGDTRQHTDINNVRSTPAREVMPDLSEKIKTTAKRGFSTEERNKKSFPDKPFKPGARDRAAKRSNSWKSRAIGLVLITVFIALILFKSDDDPVSVQTGNRQSTGQVQKPDSMLSQMVEVSGGVFLMGFDGKGATEPEKPVHPVIVSDFYIGKYEVTIGEFRKFIAATDYRTTAEQEGSSFIYNAGGTSQKAGVNWRYDINGNMINAAQDNLPVVHVSWYDAVAYCKWLSEKMGRDCRLPTEAEWEYAALGGKKNILNLSGDSSLSEVSWNGENSGSVYHQVGGKKPNALGLYDMIGNVYEWCADWYDEKAYRSGKAENPTGPDSGSKKVIRGGSWYRDGGPEYYRPTIRFLLDPKERGAKVGFRVCVSSGQ